MKAHRRSATLNNSPFTLEKISENSKPTLLKKITQKFGKINDTLSRSQSIDKSSDPNVHGKNLKNYGIIQI